MDGRPAPQGLQDSAQGFNPGNPQNKRFALQLKGREMRLPDELTNSDLLPQSQSPQLRRATVRPSDPTPPC